MSFPPTASIKKTILLILPLVIILFTSYCSEVGPGVEKVIINGTVITVDDSNSIAEAIAINADTIFAIGSNVEIALLIGDSTDVIDAEGQFIYPGFIDSHAHFLGLGKSRMNLDLMDANNWDEVVKMVADAVDKSSPGDWIVGRGWHQDKWSTPPVESFEGYPEHSILSQASPLNPVVLSHASGHALIANAQAMELAGVTVDTQDPEGGRIIRDNAGNPTGVFEENGENLINSAYEASLERRTPDQQKQDEIRQLELANEECLRNGITSFHDAGASFSTIDFYKGMIDAGKLKVRLNVMLEEENSEYKKRIADYKILGYGNNHLTVRSIKKYIDGALGSRGAWMLEPYDDLEGHTGLNVTPISELEETAKIAAEYGFQICTHAIGDKANREILNIYEREFKKHPELTDLRWRVEHAQHLSASDIPRFAKLGVIAAMQGIHCTSDATFVPKRIGDFRSEEGAYVWRKLLDSGAVVSNGTDSPVERVNPLACFYASVTRKIKDGSEFYPNQKMTRLEALKSYTINGAFACFEEKLKGSLEVGKLADITILDTDLLNCPEEKINEAIVKQTIVGGQVVYKNRESTLFN